MAQAKQLSDAYSIDAVPTIGIHGRYYHNGTSPTRRPPASTIGSSPSSTR